MPLLSGIYDSDPIQPIAKMKENLSIYTVGKWQHYNINFCEPLPPGSQSTVEMITLAGGVTLAAGGTIQKSILSILQPAELEFLHLRWEPLDNVEGILWELGGQARNVTNGYHARVDRNIRQYDPNLATTTFFILGQQRDMNLEVRNPLPVALASARFRFYGYKYLLSKYDIDVQVESYMDSITIEPSSRSSMKTQLKKGIQEGDKDIVKKIIGATAWVPAEGKAG